MRTIMILIGAGLLLSFAGCSSTSLFPKNGSEILKSEAEFGVLTAQPDVYQGRAIRLAGRMVGVETTNQGTIVVAEWLPYPNNEYEGPDDSGMKPQGRFAVFYPGKLGAEGSLHGNKFLAIGKMEGKQAMGSLGGPSRNLPYMTARCLHVWKTGDAVIETTIPDVENTGYPVTEETYCSGT